MVQGDIVFSFMEKLVRIVKHYQI